MVICVSNPVVQRAQADEIPGTCSRYNQATPLRIWNRRPYTCHNVSKIHD